MVASEETVTSDHASSFKVPVDGVPFSSYPNGTIGFSFRPVPQSDMVSRAVVDTAGQDRVTVRPCSGP